MQTIENRKIHALKVSPRKIREMVYLFVENGVEGMTCHYR